MKVKDKILEIISKKGKLTTGDVVVICKVSRQYANYVIQELIAEGRIVKIGSTKSSFYVFSKKAELLNIKTKKRLRNDSLREHEVLDDFKKQLPFIFQLPENVENILEYGFSEMLNNAIEHSNSKFINVEMKRNRKTVSFTIDDFGIGVFRSVMKKRNLKSELESIQDLIKGKTTTKPQSHSGEGIFFTSKSSDIFILESFGNRLRIDNIIDDVFVEKLKPLKKGTRVIFSINIKSKKHLSDIFKEYQTDTAELGFNKTEIKIKLFTMGTIYISRSQARRVLAGLDKFKSIILDFDKVPTIGQAFADEIFRVFIQNYPYIKIQSINANEAVQFMINRVDKPNIKEKTGKLL